MDASDSFIGEIIKMGDSLGITIPSRNVKYSGLEKGQIIRVFYKIIKEKENLPPTTDKKTFLPPTTDIND